ncbi:MAG TPA: Nif3-like dinuclear metal center hexameric protein [Clostridia bacterium]|nr:Nif3-like dinuclear metal center hexameric protein [Clostridia bacterium]
MKLNDFLQAMETVAPKALALDFDNVGLLVGPDHDEIQSVLVALDCTPATAQEAVESGADLLLAHHPVFFGGIKRLLPDDPETAGAYILARHGAGLFAAHTNLDAAEGGVNDALAAALGVTSPTPFGADGMGRVGSLAHPRKLDDFSRFVSKALGTAVRVCGEGEKTVFRAAMIGGAAGERFEEAAQAGADVYVTGECKHHHALAAAALGIAVIDAGHYETESVVLPHLIKRLQELTPGVQYHLTRREKPSLRKL